MIELAPPRRPFAWLLAINLILWQGIAAWMWRQNLVVLCGDDPSRALIAMVWSRSPFFAPGDGQWLPMPFYLYGSWHWLVGRHLHWTYWYLPAGALMTGLAATLIGWAGVLLAREGRDDRPCGWGLVGLAALAPLLVRDNWRVAPTPLSEPPYLLFLAATAALLAWQAGRRPTGPRFWIPLALALIALQMTRYEGFPLAFAAWGLACLAYPWPAEGRWRRMAIGLAAGLVVLMLFPLAWVAFNRAATGNPFAFLDVTLKKALVYRQFAVLPPERRLGLMLRWTCQQNIVVLYATLAGLWLGRRRRVMLPLVGLMLAAWIVNATVAFSNAIGAMSPSRYVLAFAWTCLPVTILLGDHLWSAGRLARAGLLLAIAAMIGLGLPPWIGAGWGESAPFGDDDAQALAMMERLARREHYKAVFNYADDGYQLNVTRFFCDPDNVLFREQFAPGHPTRGRFIYLHAPAATPTAHKVGELLGMDIEYCDQMPPRAMPTLPSPIPHAKAFWPTMPASQ
jgi:hypothetical protein